MMRILAALVFLIFPAAAQSLVVLPFINLTKNQSLNWIGESVADSLQEALGAEGVLILERDVRVQAYRRLNVQPYVQITKATMVKIGDELDAASLAFGNFELSESVTGQRPTLKLTGRLIDLRGRKQSSEFTETGSLDDLSQLEINFAWQAMKFLKPQTPLTRELFLSRHPRARLDANEQYIRGLLSVNNEQRHRFFTQAARLDPNYSQPCYQLGMMQYEKENYDVAAGWFLRVKLGDGRFRRAQFMHGLSRYWSADYASALKSFSFVADEVPVNEVLSNLGLAQMRNDSPNAIATLRKVLESDDSDPDYHFNLGYALWRKGDFAGAAERFRAVLDRFPLDDEAKQMLGRCEKRSGPRSGDAKAEGLERLKESYEESVYWQLKAMIEKK